MDQVAQYTDELLRVLKTPRRTLLQVLQLAMVVYSAVMIWDGLVFFTGSESPVVVVLSGSMEPAFHRGDILFLSLDRPRKSWLSVTKRSASMADATLSGGSALDPEVLWDQPIVKPGDVTVYQVPGKKIPIVHRCHSVFHLPNAFHEFDTNTSRGRQKHNDQVAKWSKRDNAKGGFTPVGASLSFPSAAGTQSYKHQTSILTKGDNNSQDDRNLYNRSQLYLDETHVMGRANGFLPYAGMMTIWLNDFPWLKYVLLGGMGLFVIIGRE